MNRAIGQLAPEPPLTRLDLARVWIPLIASIAVVLAVGALIRVPQDVHCLALEPLGYGAATDLKKRFIEIVAWWRGEQVYGSIESADYPPASYLLMWPFIGWAKTFVAARIAWAISSVAMLGWMTAHLVRGSGAQGRIETAFVAGMALAIYSTAATIRIGQIGFHILAPLLAATVLVVRDRRTWATDLAASALFLLALVKPTFTAPFFWIIVFAGGLRPALLTAAGYIAATVIGALPQPYPLRDLIRGWLDQGSLVDLASAHANIFTWLGSVGLERWLLPASLVILLIAGLWTWQYRDRDVWLLLAVAAIVSRIWTYHRWYDDILLLLPLVALFRIVKMREARGPMALIAAALLLAVLAFGVAPASLLSWPEPFSSIFKITKTTSWMATLVFLAYAAHVAAPDRPRRPLFSA